MVISRRVVELAQRPRLDTLAGVARPPNGRRVRNGRSHITHIVSRDISHLSYSTDGLGHLAGLFQGHVLGSIAPYEAIAQVAQLAERAQEVVVEAIHLVIRLC